MARAIGGAFWRCPVACIGEPSSLSDGSRVRAPRARPRQVSCNPVPPGVPSRATLVVPREGRASISPPPSVSRHPLRSLLRSRCTLVARAHRREASRCVFDRCFTTAARGDGNAKKRSGRDNGAGALEDDDWAATFFLPRVGLVLHEWGMNPQGRGRHSRGTRLATGLNGEIRDVLYQDTDEDGFGVWRRGCDAPNARQARARDWFSSLE